jgi:hypothetical protein
VLAAAWCPSRRVTALQSEFYTQRTLAALAFPESRSVLYLSVQQVDLHVMLPTSAQRSRPVPCRIACLGRDIVAMVPLL